ncbi:SET domain-containing protein [Nostoc sp.]|uniref:SET domain-containing protein n=1 Tax=Nostoc sp. TaxID=1180 RepID=UPI002FFBBEF9
MNLEKCNTIFQKISINECSFGKGVFASQNINKGEAILRFTGKVISLDEALAKGEKQANVLQIDTTKYIDIEEPGVTVNHSCNPNAGIFKTTVLVALISIYKGEEIFYDYSTTMSENLWTMECKCLSINCRKVIKDFHYLPPNVKKRYLDLGTVQDFIVGEHKQRTQILIAKIYPSLKIGLGVSNNYCDWELAKNCE